MQHTCECGQQFFVTNHLPFHCVCGKIHKGLAPSPLPTPEETSRKAEPVVTTHRDASPIDINIRLGDYVEGKLKAVGITQDRYVELKEAFGLPPICNCTARKEWLNRVSDWWMGR